MMIRPVCRIPNTYTWPYLVLPVAMQLDSLLEGKAEVGLAGMTVNAQIYPDGREEAYFYASGLLSFPGIVRALGLTVLSGDPEKALATPGHVVLTESLARKIFGKTDVVGQTLRLPLTGCPIG